MPTYVRSSPSRAAAWLWINPGRHASDLGWMPRLRDAVCLLLLGGALGGCWPKNDLSDNYAGPAASSGGAAGAAGAPSNAGSGGAIDDAGAAGAAGNAGGAAGAGPIDPPDAAPPNDAGLDASSDAAADAAP